MNSHAMLDAILITTWQYYCIGLSEHSCSMSGPITAWMGDCLTILVHNQPPGPRSTQPSIALGNVNQVKVCLAGVMHSLVLAAVSF